jgi:4-diphosphocytidyl-2-C-methyl-D-erythritol kinase
MITFPNCKINLGLNILQKREDGYHDIETIFYPLNICDALELITITGTQPIQFSCTGLHIDGDEQNNLCTKAYQLLKKDFPQLPAIKMHLHKTVPVGAGLGGGSANAAFTLMLLNKKFQLNLSSDQLINYASQLGSDCSFFIINKPCFATGRGEILEPIELDLSAYQFLVINPFIHISTKWAFTKTQPAPPSESIKQIAMQPVEMWRALLANDFEKPLIQYYPQLKLLKEKLYDIGALYASMSGSGSTFFGIFDKDKKIDTSFFPPEYFIKLVKPI